jgi:hypothetical protein
MPSSIGFTDDTSPFCSFLTQIQNKLTSNGMISSQTCRLIRYYTGGAAYFLNEWVYNTANICGK